MSESAASPRWDEAERAWLTVARKRAGHTQVTCAAYLKKTYRVADASQALVSRWISGNIKRPGCVVALLAYCEHFAPDARPPLIERGTKVPPDTLRPDTHPRADSSSALAQELSSQLRVLRTQLKREQTRSNKLSQSLADLNAELTSALVRIGQLDQTARSYS